MTSPFDVAGISSIPKYQAAAPAKDGNSDDFATNPVKTAEEPDKFTLSDADKEAVKAEIKSEIQAEQAEAEAEAGQIGPIKKFKRFIGTIKKSVTTANEYAKGVIKGIGTGAIVGSLAFTGLSILKKEKAAKVFGVIGAIAGVGVQIWNASLRANENRAQIDHTWENTPIKR